MYSLCVLIVAYTSQNILKKKKTILNMYKNKQAFITKKKIVNLDFNKEMKKKKSYIFKQPKKKNMTALM